MGGFFCAFVDGGYLRAGGAKTLGKSTQELRIDGEALMAWLRNVRAFDKEDELLRAYWYDGEFDTSDPRHETQRRFFDALDSVPGLEVRKGYLVERLPRWHHALKRALRECGVDLVVFERHFDMKPDLVQKGVDTLITMDLIHHSDSDNYAWALLVAGDRDLVDPVRSVQDDGHRVAIALPRGAGIAPELRRRADKLIHIEPETLRSFMTPRPERSADVPLLVST